MEIDEETRWIVEKIFDLAYRGAGAAKITNVRRDKNKITPINLILSLMIFNFLSKPDFIAYNKRDRHSFPVKLAVEFHKAPKFVWTVKGEEERNTAKISGENAIFEIS